MPRKQPPTDDQVAEYLSLSNFSIAFMDLKVCGLEVEFFPLKTELDEIDLKRFATHMRGLRMAVNDCLEDSSDFPPDKVAAFDRRLREGGIITLSDVRLRHGGKIDKILERGRIRSEVEYYLVAGVLASCSDDLDQTQRARLDAMADDYGRRRA
jgi:hypothetical protein